MIKYEEANLAEDSSERPDWNRVDDADDDEDQVGDDRVTASCQEGRATDAM